MGASSVESGGQKKKSEVNPSCEFAPEGTLFNSNQWTEKEES